MKVLMVTPSYHPIVGGAETLIRSFSTKLNEMGIPTDIMTFNMDRKWTPTWHAKTEKIDGINVFKIPALNWFPLEHSYRITLRINLIPGRFQNRLKDYDIVHFHDGDDLSFPLFSYFVRKPKILHFHGFPTNFFKRYFLCRLMLKSVADLYISPSQLIENGLIEVGVPKYKIRRLPNGPIDVNLFRSSGKKRDNLILFVGRITFNKGLHILIKSLNNLKKSIHLVIIGPPWDARYLGEMLKLIENKNKGDLHKITYLGVQDHRNVAKWCQRASVFVLPSLVEAGGIVNLEAMSCETPVVATNVGGVPEFVRDGETGLLVPANNPDRLAESIQYLLDNEDVRIKFGREGRKWVVKHFSVETVVERLCRIYEEIFDLNYGM
ncbi:MAG: glycosyltransferase family 4 protein [bacterium]